MEVQKFQTCPCCNQSPMHKQTLLSLLDYIAKEAKQINADYMIQNAIANNKIDEMDEKFRKGNLMQMFNALGKGLDAINDFEERMIMLKGRLSAFEDIAKHLQL